MYRNNMPRLFATGTVGTTSGFKWIEHAPSQGDFDADSDGVMSPVHMGLIDLSDVASQLLGQQVPQSARYNVKRIWMMLRNVDDIVDNDEGNWFSGSLRWWYPTQHRLEALRLAREAEKFSEGDEMDGDGFFLSSDNDYGALRLGWMANDGTGVVDQVRHQSNEDFTQMAGNQWNLQTVFSIYNQMEPSTKSNALWTGRAGDMTCKIPYTVSSNSAGRGLQEDTIAVNGQFNSGRIDADVLAGLLAFTVADSGGDEGGAVDDDYRMIIGIEFDVGVDA